PGPIPVRPYWKKDFPILSENGFQVWVLDKAPFLALEYAYLEWLPKSKSVLQEISIQEKDPSSLYLKSFLFIEKETEATLSVSFSGEIKIMINGQTVFVSRATHNEKEISIALSFAKGFQEVEIL